MGPRFNLALLLLAGSVSGNAIQQRQVNGPAACSDVVELVNACSSEAPNFDNLPPASQALCLCYSSTSWLPTVFDDLLTICLPYAQTADSELASAVAGLEGFCTSVGNVLAPASNSAGKTTAVSTPLTTPKPTTTGSVIVGGGGGGGGSAACNSVADAIDSCGSATPGFTDLDDASQAPCLCYVGTSYAPQIFDGYISSCAGYAYTLNPTFSSDVSALQGFCSSIGPVPGAGASKTAAATSTNSPFILTTPSSKSTPTSTKAPTTTATTVQTKAATPNAVAGKPGLDAPALVVAMAGALFLV